MDNKTVVFDVQREIAELKRRVAQLESEKVHYGQPLKVSDWPNQAHIFGPTFISSGLHDTPLESYKTNPELLDTLKQVAKNFKENKLD